MKQNLVKLVLGLTSEIHTLRSQLTEKEQALTTLLSDSVSVPKVVAAKPAAQPTAKKQIKKSKIRQRVPDAEISAAALKVASEFSLFEAGDVMKQLHLPPHYRNRVTPLLKEMVKRNQLGLAKVSSAERRQMGHAGPVPQYFKEAVQPKSQAPKRLTAEEVGKQVKAHLAKQPTINSTELQKLLKQATPTRAVAALRGLVADGVLTEVQPARGPKPAVYSATLVTTKATGKGHVNGVQVSM